MSEYSIPTIPLRVSLWLADGRRVNGDVFLPEKSAVREGPMLAGEWANLLPAFLPLREGERQVAVLARDHIVAIALPPGIPAEGPEDTADARVCRVQVETAGGFAHRGRISIAMPSHRQRTVDFLNTPDPYLTLSIDGEVHLINKRHIIRVTELGED